MADVTRTLVLLRHASAEGNTSNDLARELSAQGFAEAKRLGQWLGERGLLGDVVWCSPAIRTRQTWAAIEEVSGHGVVIDFSDDIYEAAPENLLEVLRETSTDARVAVLVGHAPGIPYAAYLLTDGHGNPDALAGLNAFVPASAAVIQFDGEWRDVAPGVGELVSVRLGDE